MYKDTVIDWGNWKNELKKHYGITYLKSFNEVIDLQKSLLCSRCSKVKNITTTKNYPENFYLSKSNRRFYAWCNFFDFEFAILSDKYGLHFFDESLETYDIHPSVLKEENFIELSKLIKKKMIERGYNSFTFYYSSPLMFKPYFYMMYLTGFPIYFITRLHNKS